jgi:HD-GYP domain-containing protein (c-di-GMP phosphodiesterase class II)
MAFTFWRARVRARRLPRMDLDDLVGETRERRLKSMSARERTVVGALALALLATSVGLTFLLPGGGDHDPFVVAALVGMFAVASRVEFEIGPAYSVATQLVFVPMLFLVPLPLVPLLVGLAYLIAELPDFIQRKTHHDRWLYCIADAWFAVGPVAVIGLLAAGEPSVDNMPIYLLALTAQGIAGYVPQALLDSLARGLSPRSSLSASLWAFGVDAALSPIGVIAAAAAAESRVTVLAVAPLLWLLRVFSKERTERFAAALELQQTYRGTVMVLSDVVEADDNYTADHCRSVVELTIATADVLRLTREQSQDLETAALLHDVGKIAIPKEILNKPAKLTDEEFELMKSHTLEGQALLDRVGGRLARVGEIVRSCHERWDGQGYPDGLRGEEIPLAARIVFCCDAYSAMTTDRPYRAATTPEAAMAELRANAGSQFEPRIVEAVCQVIADDLRRGEGSYADAVRAVLASNKALAPRAEVV